MWPAVGIFTCTGESKTSYISMTTGTVTKYDPRGETGYISPDKDDESIPFDRKCLVDFADDDFPKPGDRVSFTVEGGMAGLWAVNVRRIE